MTKLLDNFTFAVSTDCEGKVTVAFRPKYAYMDEGEEISPEDVDVYFRFGIKHVFEMTGDQICEMLMDSFPPIPQDTSPMTVVRGGKDKDK